MSEILFLGTGAADWTLADQDGFFRRNSAALLNRELMLDCGEHIFSFAESAKEPNLYRTVTDLLLTHHHSDHYSKASILKLAETQKLRIGCDPAFVREIGTHPNISYLPLAPYQCVTLGNYRVTPVLANHDCVADGDSYAFHYIIETPDQKTLFYGADGAWFLRPTWEEMLRHRFDVMILDCTVGDMDDWRIFEHNTIPMLRMMVREIQNRTLLTPNGVLVASHLAKTLHPSHEETAEILKKIGMQTAFDGMTISF